MSEKIIDIICLETKAFYALIDKVVDHIKAKNEISEDIWIDEYEAMKMLRISSKSTLQKYRDERRIRFSQPSKKIIVYDKNSIHEYIQKNVK